MRKLPIILTILCSVLWFYGCWYWYTCHIKDFCLSGNSFQQISTGSLDQEDEFPLSQEQEILSVEEVST